MAFTSWAKVLVSGTLTTRAPALPRGVHAGLIAGISGHVAFLRRGEGAHGVIERGASSRQKHGWIRDSGLQSGRRSGPVRRSDCGSSGRPAGMIAGHGVARGLARAERVLVLESMTHGVLGHGRARRGGQHGLGHNAESGRSRGRGGEMQKRTAGETRNAILRWSRRHLPGRLDREPWRTGYTFARAPARTRVVVACSAPLTPDRARSHSSRRGPGSYSPAWT